MRQFLATAAAAAAVAFVAAPASAAIVDFSGTFSVAANQGSGLIINTSSSSNLFHFQLDDDVLNDTASIIPLFKISTPESDVGADDLAPQPITVTFNFNQPSGGVVPVTGSTVGQSTWVLFLNFQNGSVSWDAPPVFSFGNTGKVSIDLSDTTFGSGLYGLSSKSAKVNAKFTLTELPSAVPEPATWAMMITGFGLAGTALRRRRETVVVA